jgi:Enolase
MSVDSLISDLRHRIIFDSRGDKTVEATVFLKKVKGIASCPSGISTGIYEVKNLPSGDLRNKVREFNELSKKELIGKDSANQREIDEILHKIDGTEDLSNFGAVNILSTSIANIKAYAYFLDEQIFKVINKKSKYTLPIPLGNMIGGGKHARGLSIDLQEILVACKNAENIYQAIEANTLLHKKCFQILSKEDMYFSGGKNDEGAWITRIGNRKAVEIVKKAVQQVKSEKGYDFIIGIDFAASSIFDKRRSTYNYKLEKINLNREQQYKFVSSLIEEFNISFVEDPFDEDDFEDFSQLRKDFKDILIVGDDIYASNKERLKKGIEKNSSNGIIIKPNQVGSVSRIIDTIKYAKENSIQIIVSHRSGETEDPFISHLATAFDAPLIKTGAVGGERMAKLNELIRIEEYLGSDSKLNNYISYMFK